MATDPDAVIHDVRSHHMTLLLQNTGSPTGAEDPTGSPTTRARRPLRVPQPRVPDVHSRPRMTLVGTQHQGTEFAGTRSTDTLSISAVQQLAGQRMTKDAAPTA
jgi:hypothetical protein